MNGDNWFDCGSQWMRTWLDLTSKMTEAGTSFSMPASPTEAARQMRTDVLQAWSECFERFMRSPDFLQWMKSALGTNLESQQRWNETLGTAQHQLQAATRQDIDELMRAAGRIENGLRRMAAQLDALEARVEAIDDELSSPETAPQRNTTAAEINGHTVRPVEETDAVESRPARPTRRKAVGKRRLT
jgi:hypothetical protein